VGESRWRGLPCERRYSLPILRLRRSLRKRGASVGPGCRATHRWSANWNHRHCYLPGFHDVHRDCRCCWRRSGNLNPSWSHCDYCARNWSGDRHPASANWNCPTRMGNADGRRDHHRDRDDDHGLSSSPRSRSPSHNRNQSRSRAGRSSPGHTSRRSSCRRWNSPFPCRAPRCSCSNSRQPRLRAMPIAKRSVGKPVIKMKSVNTSV